MLRCFLACHCAVCLGRAGVVLSVDLPMNIVQNWGGRSGQGTTGSRWVGAGNQGDLEPGSFCLVFKHIS